MAAETDRYRIGAVSRLTGIPAVTLRAWERRYQAVEADRDTGGSRLYSAEDIERLTLIRRLVDMGNAVSTVARLPLEELQARIAADREQMLRSHADEQREQRIAVAGATLATLFDSGDLASGLTLVGTVPQVEDIEVVLKGHRLDVLVLEYSSLQPDSADEIHRLMRLTRAWRAVVIYEFAARSVLQRLEADNVTVVAAPASRLQIELLCLAPARRPVPQAETGDDDATVSADPVPVRRFTNDDLAQFSAASSAIECECPHHLSTLIRSLVSFERYSAECENRNSDDAALHAYLHRTTATARASLEQALVRVARAEGLL
ncbi:MAG: MerR family transcriptional regulator [Gammaproteobacteria bacterium]|nr:MerR family transcriptional regulator [Gammaproteobacteria bacterium]